MSDKEELKTIYEEIGGESILKDLVNKFYDIMDSNPDYKVIRDMHAKDLSLAREKLFMFLSGWMGGPQLYINKYGHPRLRARHLPFPIAESERDQWINCMTEALNKAIKEQKLQDELRISLYQVADFMRNKA